MTVRRYTKIPVSIEAMQWTKGTSPQELRDFTNNLVEIDDVDEEFQVYDRLHDTWVNFTWDDWIIKGIKGEFYPCASEVFAATYRLDAGQEDKPLKRGTGSNQVSIYPRQYGKRVSIAEQMARQGFGPYGQR